MAKIHKVDYFVMRVAHRAGEGAKLLKALKKQDVGLLAFTAFPAPGGAQIDFVPEDTAQFMRAVRTLDWKVSLRKIGFLVTGKDRTGALAGILNKLGKERINVVAMDGITAGKRRFGAIFWVKPKDVARTVRLLGVK